MEMVRVVPQVKLDSLLLDRIHRIGHAPVVVTGL